MLLQLLQKDVDSRTYAASVNYIKHAWTHSHTHKMHNMWLWNCTHLRGLVKRHWHKEPAVHTNTSVPGNIASISPQLSHSLKNAVKMSLKRFVLTIENRQLHARVQRNSSHSVNGTTGSYGGGWRNVEFKYGWCRCIKPVSANQLCSWKESERHAGITGMFTLKAFKIHMPLIFSEVWVSKKRLFCLCFLIIHIIALSRHQYIPLENDFMLNPLFLFFFSVDLQCWSAAYTVLWRTIRCPYQAS